MKRKSQALLLANSNTEDKNLRKTIEELAELTVELLQKLNKPHKNNDKEIIKEIADVKIRMYYLTDRFGKATINNAIDTKLKYLNKHVNIRRRSN
tara:strand:- start:2187 stop:2471 length:285 start_codon:yes stop_codon:yes gene_type:complete